MATKYHHGQKRKYTGVDYVTHPFAVKDIILNHFGPKVKKEILVAAILHDMLEDTLYTESQMLVDFGSEVTDIVKAVTNDKSIGNRKERKLSEEILFATIPHPTREWAYVVRLADIYHNTPSIALYDKNFWKVYKREKENLLKVIHSDKPDLVHPLFNSFLIKVETLFTQPKQYASMYTTPDTIV
jgi:(p)ppGpp synthase/HD superfamily hydrolase